MYIKKNTRNIRNVLSGNNKVVLEKLATYFFTVIFYIVWARNSRPQDPWINVAVPSQKILSHFVVMDLDIPHCDLCLRYLGSNVETFHCLPILHFRRYSFWHKLDRLWEKLKRNIVYMKFIFFYYSYKNEKKISSQWVLLRHARVFLRGTWWWTLMEFD